MKSNTWRKITLILMVIAIVSGSLFIDHVTIPKRSVLANQSDIDQLNQQIKELEQEQKEHKQEQSEISAEKKQLEQEKQRIESEIRSLEAQINETEENINQKQVDIAETEEHVRQVTEELQEAQKQLEIQNDLLKTRVRHMYEQGGNVSFLEVLLGSTSFGDFLHRVDFLRLIVQQDQKILEDYIRHQEIVQEKKQEIENLLVELEEQLQDLQVLERSLANQKKQRSVRVATIDQEYAVLEELDEKIQQEVLNLVNEVSAKRKKIKDHQEEMERIQRERERQQAQQQAPSNGKLAWPVPSSQRITSPFGYRIHPITGRPNGHSGLDIGASVPGRSGDTIVAAESGVVVVAQTLSSYGNAVVIDHGNNVRTLYAHIRPGGIKVKVGQGVQRGQKVAEMGSTGSSTAPHLHFEVHVNGQQVNPYPYLR